MPLNGLFFTIQRIKNNCLKWEPRKRYFARHHKFHRYNSNGNRSMCFYRNNSNFHNRNSVGCVLLCNEINMFYFWNDFLIPMVYDGVSTNCIGGYLHISTELK